MKLVIVDNDKALLRSWKLILRNKGYEVSCFDTPALAYQYFMSGAQADVFITDYRMPEMNGDLIIRASRKNNFNIDVYVLISGHLDEMSDNDRQHLNADFTLKKPVDLQELLQLLRNLERERTDHA